ncbi:bifunctional riboflavin kinase/FAD synthetase [Campylobacter sp. US33a]|uniref:bifunctional riboflavin kinase/FAD synthetase n=1 Tax=Campylobacter sp. US33a TaxID=2498120 RepID=UPI001067E686|nr:bifunctional riboflavin kinase/FAD synthetase [Campylobacter sp. US33a]TEY02424.1 bifunctional riboflavin kinase/FAD synthetase [Campylobacter sp. US33a]
MWNISTTTQKDKITSIAIGCFDGVHLGHKKLISHLDDFGVLLVIDKFKGKKLCDNEQKVFLANKNLIELDFESIKNLDGREFLQILKKEFINLEKIVVGYDFSFGKNRAFKAIDIEKLSEIKTIIVDEFSIDKIGVHSSKIKEFLEQGDIKNANLFLGRTYSIKGKVIKGQGLGKKELFATLNLKCDEYFLPKNGVYATFAKYKNKSYKSVSFIGIRSTDESFAIESHIIENFDEKVKTDDAIELFFVDFLRQNQRFDDLKLLKEQIAKDIEKAKKLLG